MIFKLKGISIFLALFFIGVLVIKPSLTLANYDAHHQKIKLGAEILHMQICNDNALVSVKKNHSDLDATLFRVDLTNFTAKQIYLSEMQNASLSYFDCDEKTGNYFVVDEKNDLNLKEDPIVLAYSPKPSDHLLWKFTFDSSYIYPQVEDFIVAQNKEVVLVRIFHIRIPDQNGNRKDIPGDIYALNKTNGKILWKLSLGVEDQRPEINIIDDTFYLTYGAGHIDAYDLDTGALKWKFKGKYAERYFKPQLDPVSKTLITACDTNSVYQTVEIIGIDVETGKLKWQVPVKSWVRIPENLSEILTRSREFIYSRSEGAYVDINWLELPENGDTPIHIYQWRSGYNEKRGGVRLITGMNEYFSLVNFDDLCTYVFDYHGSKRDDLTKLPEEIYTLQTFKKSILYTTLEGELGLIKVRINGVQ